jgi:hypothetical protein
MRTECVTDYDLYFGLKEIIDDIDGDKTDVAKLSAYSEALH